jgi:hypothetical protein
MAKQKRTRALARRLTDLKNNIMKTHLSPLLILLVAIFTGCSRNYETVEIAPDVFLKLPVNYTIAEDKNLVPQIHYEAKFENDKISVFRLPADEFDTLSLEQKRQVVKSYIKSSVPTYNVTKVDTSDTILGDILQIDMNIDYDKGNSQFRDFTRFYILKNDMIAIMYQTNRPVSKNSEITRNRIFNSLKVK